MTQASLPVILAVDTSTRNVGLALYDGSQVLCERIWTSRDYHTVELAPAVKDILSTSEIKVCDLGAVAVAIGPGSFTGIRIGMAFSKGLALALRTPLVGVPTLDILAFAQPTQSIPLVAVLRAGRGRLAVGWYQLVGQTWRATGFLEVLSPEELSQRIREPTLVCGELTADERQLLARKRKNVHLVSPAGSLRRASFLAEIGWRRWQNGDFDDPVTLAPIYLHQNEPISVP